MGGNNEHISERFQKLLALYRKPDGAERGGRDLENATGGAAGRSYAANLEGGRVGNPGLAELGAIAGAVGFPPAPWFGEGEGAAPPTTPCWRRSRTRPRGRFSSRP